METIRTQVTCSGCGAAATVPFAPTPGRPVYCRSCFATRAPSRPSFDGPRRPAPAAVNARQRMMAQGRKTHFLFDARSVLHRTEGGMDDQHIRAFLEGLFARGARTSTAAAQDFLDEKVTEEVITPEQRRALGDLVERYSFWR